VFIETALVPGLVAVVAAFISFPLVRWLALRLGVTDRPDNHRKLHARLIPLGGGICVAIGMVAGIAASPLFDAIHGKLSADRPGPVLSLIGAGLLIIVLGLVDDRFGLRGRHKLVGQILVALLLAYFGYLVRSVQIFGVQFDLGIFAIPFTLGWFILAINSINLIDGIDGLATIVGIILSASLCCVAVLSGHTTEAVVLAVLVGGLVGFLPFNFPPAKMFLGDTGSMLIGLVLGAMAIRGSLKGPATVALAAPLAVWTIPLFDTMAAILRRKLTGRSIYTTDRGHLHHCLQQLSGSNHRTLYWVILACGSSCMGALFSVYLKSDILALISAIAVISVLVATRAFGYGEFMLVSGRVRSLFRSLRGSAGSNPPVHQAVRLQGTKPWETLWELLLEVTDDFNLTQVSLDVNVPASHEGYHVTWKRPAHDEDFALWHAEMPLYCDGRLVGRASFAGPHNGFSACGTVAGLMEFLATFEEDVRTIVGAAKPAALDGLGSVGTLNTAGPVGSALGTGNALGSANAVGLENVAGPNKEVSLATMRAEKESGLVSSSFGHPSI
jgi:UDP-GlcNAc:undecaprenyl-phosphate/decaprenyl-phosphate GlcNAc-1-phosphate transferase